MQPIMFVSIEFAQYLLEVLQCQCSVCTYCQSWPETIDNACSLYVILRCVGQLLMCASTLLTHKWQYPCSTAPKSGLALLYLRAFVTMSQAKLCKVRI